MYNTATTTNQVKRKKKHNYKRTIFIILMLAIPVTHFALFWVYVNFNSILMAFQIRDGYGIHWGFDNFARFFHEVKISELDLGIAIKNTLLLFLVGTVIGMPVTLLLSYFLFKKIKGYKVFRVVFFLPSIISAAVLVAMFKYLFRMDGPVNNLLSMFFGKTIDNEWLVDDKLAMGTILFYCFWTGFGGGLVLFTGAMHRIPEEVLEYCVLDGVSPVRELFQIIVPMIWPTISTQLVFAFAGLFVNAGPILLFTEGQYKTMTIGYFILQEVRNGSYEYPSAIGLLFSVLGFPLVIFVKWICSRIFEDVEY